VRIFQKIEYVRYVSSSLGIWHHSIVHIRAFYMYSSVSEIYISILYRSKVAYFNLPHLYFARLLGWRHTNFIKHFCVKLYKGTDWVISSIKPRLHDTTGCQTVLTIGCQPVWQPCWTNSHCSFNRLSRRVVGPTTGLTTGFMHDTAMQLSNQLSNGFDNRLNVRIHDTTGVGRL